MWRNFKFLQNADVAMHAVLSWFMLAWRKIETTNVQGVFFHWNPQKKLKYGKPRLGESTLT